MKGICVTGVSPLDTARVAEILHQAGMQSAKPAGRDGAMGMAFWHDEVMAAMAEDADGLQPIENPGRLWEQLASDIFLANMKSKVWGWADVRSTWLLDYWKDFEPRLKFVLVVTAPQAMLAHAIAADEEVADLDATMSTWLAQQQELLRFYHRNTDRCLLVDAQDCTQHPQALVQLCKKQWKLALDTSTALATEAKAASPISQYLANKLCQGYPEAIGLQHEVAATLSHLAADADAPKAAEASISVKDLVADYRALCQGNGDNLAQRDADNQARLSALQAQTDQLTQENASLAATNAQLTSAAVELTAQRDVEIAAKSEAQAQRDAEAKARAEVQARRDALAGEKTQLSASRDALTQEKAGLAAQLEAQSKLAAEHQASLAALQAQSEHLAQEKANLIAANAQLTSAAAELTAQRDSMGKTHEETKQESELLLLQLHQVQEELETYFLKHQEAQGQLDAAKAEVQALQSALHSQLDSAAHQSAVVDAGAKSTIAQLTQKLNQLVAERDAETQAKLEAIAECGRLADDLSQVSAARDGKRQRLAELQARCDAESAAKAEALTARDAEAAAKAEALAQRDAEANAKSEALSQRDALSAEKAQLSATRDAITQEKADLATQLAAQTQLAAERQASLAALHAQSDQLAQEKANLIASNAQLTGAAAELTAQRDAEAAAEAEALAAKDAEAHARQEALTRFNTLAKQLDETKQESELLLLQLHQVQEELEHYFLQHQEAQRKVSDADQRWQRMLQRTPEYCDFESIEVLSDEATGGENGAALAHTTVWRIKNLTAAGRSIAQLDFKTAVEGGQAHFVIPRAEGTVGWLTRWPVDSAEQTELVVPRDAAAADIASRDWLLLKLLGKLLATTLQSPEKLQAPAHFQAEEVRMGVSHLGDALDRYPEVLRYDAVTLKREQVNPDYEHLWLSLQNLSLGERSWSAFEFRLSAANVGPKRFGTHPKLEFPEHVGQAPFANWFDESYDDFGAKLELRFALPDAMDITIWGRLAAPDQAFLQALVQSLPGMLATLQHAGTKLKRAWADWIHMANEVQRVVGLRVAALKAPAPAPTPVIAQVVVPHPAPVPQPLPVAPVAPVAPVIVRVAQPKAPPIKSKAKPAPAAKARKAK